MIITTTEIIAIATGIAIAMFLFVIAVLITACKIFTENNKDEENDRYQYRVEKWSYDNPLPDFKELGNNGWKLIAMEKEYYIFIKPL